MEKNDIFEFDACGSYEAELPREITEAYDIIECLSVSEGCDTLLIQKKESGQKAVVKCCRRADISGESMRRSSVFYGRVQKRTLSLYCAGVYGRNFIGSVCERPHHDGGCGK